MIQCDETLKQASINLILQVLLQGLSKIQYSLASFTNDPPNRERFHCPNVYIQERKPFLLVGCFSYGEEMLSNNDYNLVSYQKSAQSKITKWLSDSYNHATNID